MTLQEAIEARHSVRKYIDKEIPANIIVALQDKIAEFNKKGKWTELDCKTSAVPTSLIPEQIRATVQQTFPGATIIKIDRVRKGYEVKLNNRMEMKFNKRFNIIEFDD